MENTSPPLSTRGTSDNGRSIKVSTSMDHDSRHRIQSPDVMIDTTPSTTATTATTFLNNRSTTDLDSLSPLPSINTKFTPKQDEIRMMNVLNGEIEKNWTIDEDSYGTGGTSSKSTSTFSLSSNSTGRNKTTGSAAISKPAKSRTRTSFSSMDSLASLSNDKRNIQRLTRRMSDSNATPMSLLPYRNYTPANATSLSQLRKQIINSHPKPIAYHRVKDMFEQEDNPHRAEILAERVVTSFIKHERLKSSTELTDYAGMPMESETQHDSGRKRNAMELDTANIPEYSLESSENNDRFEVFETVGASARGRARSIDMANFDREEYNLPPPPVEDKGDMTIIPKAKRKLSSNDSPETSRYSNQSTSTTKMSYIRPGTPSPSSSTCSTSPWISHITPEKLKKLRPNFERSNGDLRSSYDNLMDTTNNNSTISMSFRNRTPSSSSMTRITPRLYNISSSVDDQEDESEKSPYQSETTLNMGESQNDLREWRQTDEDENWEYEDDDYE